MYAPLRLELDSELSLPSHHGDERVSSATTQIDIGKVFKGKSDKKKPVPSQTQSQQAGLRGKKTITSAKGSIQPGLKPSGSSSQLSSKK